jgi:hypothetical protein
MMGHQFSGIGRLHVTTWLIIAGVTPKTLANFFWEPKN